MAVFEQQGAVEALEVALAAAEHLTGRDAAAVATARQLARRVDAMAEYGWGDPDSGKFDNVTVPTFLKFLEALRLLPAPAERTKPGPTSTASPSQQALNEMRRGLSIVS